MPRNCRRSKAAAVLLYDATVERALGKHHSSSRGCLQQRTAIGLLPSAELDALVRRRLSVSQQPEPFWVFEICTISALQGTVTLAGLPSEVRAVEAAVRRAILFSRCRETRSL